MPGKQVDFRSDTVTMPTPQMREAMYKAEVGDDVYSEDPTVNELEELAAHLLGKEAGLFVTSGTQGNLIAILTHTRPGQEVILESESHIFYYEVGGAALIGGVQFRTLPAVRGAMKPSDVEAAIRPCDIHFPPTGLICIENTHNRAGGAVIPISNLAALAAIGTRHKIPLHLDGARLFNAAVALNVEAREIADHFDSVSLCLSKGLGAPVGSVIVGRKDWIKQARKWRKRLGGGMRQAGILAAPGIIALKEMIGRLAEDHALAKYLANGLANMPGLDVTPPDTNIVLVDVKSSGQTAVDILHWLTSNGVLATDFGPTTIRFVTHKDVDQSSADKVLAVMNNILKGEV
ncbi:MAG: low-specificity L-threonine aldolase [bacterium]|jgi:threonine aldolase